MSLKFRLDGKVAVVTGGGKGIGQSIAKAFTAAGARVHILEIDMASAQNTVTSCPAGSVKLHECNIVDQAAVKSVISKIEDDDDIDILVNNAGVGFVGNLEATDQATFGRLFDINVKGVYNCLYATVPYMKSRKRGVILNMASTVSTVAIPDRFAYTATKGAVLTMTYSVALDYLEHGLRCNAIAPGRVHTPFVDDYIAKNYADRAEEMFDILSKTQPIGRMAQPTEVADLALYLCSDESSFITGQCYGIDGGFLNLRP